MFAHTACQASPAATPPPLAFDFVLDLHEDSASATDGYEGLCLPQSQEHEEEAERVLSRDHQEVFSSALAASAAWRAQEALAAEHGASQSMFDNGRYRMSRTRAPVSSSCAATPGGNDLGTSPALSCTSFATTAALAFTSPRDELLLGTSQQQSMLGRGRFGSVSLVRTEVTNDSFRDMDKSDIASRGVEDRAVKVIDAAAEPHSAAVELLVAERLMKAADVDNRVVRNIVEVFEADFDGLEHSVTVSMEHLSGGRVSDHAAFRSTSGCPESASEAASRESRLRRVAADVCFGLHVCESVLRVIHRDVKPQNIMLAADGTAKLVDFGVAAVLAEGDSPVGPNLLATDQRGSMSYMSPERLLGEPHGCNSDVWSLGIVLLQLACRGVHPFDLRQSTSSDPLDPFWKAAEAIQHTGTREECAGATARMAAAAIERAGLAWSADFADFVKLCLEVDPTRRVSASSLLRHRWIAGLLPNERF